MTRQLSFGTILALSLFGTLGCGAAEYERRMQSAAQQIQTNQERAKRLNDNLHGGAAIGDAAVEIRVPKVFEASFAPDSPHPADGAKIDPRRLQPPFLNLPNLKLTYEAFAEAADGKQYPFYCYLAATQGASAEAGKLADELARQLRAALPGGAGWETVACPTPDGGSLSVRRLRARGRQLFDRTPPGGGRANFGQLDGTFDLYLYEANGWIALVGFRVPAAAADKFPLDEIGPLSVGTLKGSS